MFVYNFFNLAFIYIIALSAGAQSLDKVYFQLSEEDKALTASDPLLRLTDLRKLDFGLSLEQQEVLFEISEGKVDLRNIYSINASVPFVSLLAYKNYSFGSTQFLPPVQMTPLDPKAEEGWWMKSLKIQEAWQYATGENVVIANCDAGYYIEESDIRPNLLLQYGKDLADLDEPTNISNGNYVNHGTSVVAIMSGVLDGLGINGIAYKSQVIPLQNYNYSAGLDDIDKEEATALCVLEAVKNPKTHIIVLENQTYGSSETFAGTRAAVTLSLMSGIPVVSAAGNSSNNLVDEENFDTGSIIVGAVDRSGMTEGFSNYGSRVSIAAYGSNILTLWGPSGQFGMFGGTSASTPQVAGTVALLLDMNPYLLPEDIKEILINTRLTTSENQNVGGLVQPLAALEMLDALYSPLPTPEYLKRKEFHTEIIKILQ